MTFYHCKKQKSVVLISTLYPDVEIPSHKNPSKKPETVLFYNKTKSGVEVIDQMARKYSVKVESRRWPVHVFYNVIDLALINSWILFRNVCKSNVNRCRFIQLVGKVFTRTNPGDDIGKNVAAQ